MAKAVVFSGQGSQFVGMGNVLLEKYLVSPAYFEIAHRVMGFDLGAIMRTGTEDDLRQTLVTQPAIFLYSVALFESQSGQEADAYAGHSLGEFSALVAAGVLPFEQGLILVKARAEAMQEACEAAPSTMAAVLGLADEVVESTLAQITDEVVVPANYNTPGQLVISGSPAGIEKAAELLKQAGAKRVVPLQVGGAFHSPFMAVAQAQLNQAIDQAVFEEPSRPIYQNVTAKPSIKVQDIKSLLKAQLTSPVRWTQIVENMVADDISEFVECGPGTVLQGLVKKINKDVAVSGL